MSNPKQPRATAYDVASLAGVSQAAVSRAFTPGGSVAKATRLKIIEAAKELGYRPNAFARSLTTQQSGIVGIAAGRLANPYFSTALEEFSGQLSRADLRLLLFPAHFETSIEQVMQYRVEVLIMLSVPPSADLVTECEAGDIPIIMFNRRPRHEDKPCVIGDNQTGGRMLAAYLLAGGHERFAFISAGDESTASNEREVGFRDYLTEHNIAAFRRESAAFSVEQAATATRRLLLQQDRPDAIFCANDHVAITAIQVAQSEFGVDVGREISIVGFDDVPQASWPGIALTTYSQPVDKMVEATIELIRAMRDGRAWEPVTVVPGDLIVRSSARRPIRPIRE
jgi:DNA-binding LacI/PurR family transcriptional regulator